MEFKVVNGTEMNSIGEPTGYKWGDTTIHVIATDENGLAGKLSLIAPTHAEAAYVREDLRGTTLLSRLEAKMEEAARKQGITSLLAFQLVGDEDMERYLAGFDFKLMPIVVWQKEI